MDIRNFSNTPSAHFNPSLLPALVLSQGVPPVPASPDDFFALLAKFMSGTRTDIRDASKPVAQGVRRAFAMRGAEVEITDQLDVRCKMQGDTEDAGVKIYGGVTNEGAMLLGVEITAMDRTAFAALLDFAAAGLAAMDSHALQNGWQR